MTTTIHSPLNNERYFYLLTDLPSDTLRISMEFLGLGHYRLVGGSCRALRDSYCEVDPKQQTTWKNMATSLSCAKLYYHDHKQTQEALESIAEAAAANGNLQVIQWAHEHGIVWSPAIGTAAASHGHLPVLKLLKKQCRLYRSQRLQDLVMNKSNEFETWNIESLGAAAYSGQLDIVKFLLWNGCQAKWYGSEVCARAAEGGQIEILRYFHSRGYTFDAKVAEAAAKGGQLETLKYLREEVQCESNYQACCAASGAGHIEVVRYLHQLGCAWDSTTFRSAIKSGRLEIVRYLYENGCPTPGHLSSRIALERGHVDILRYLLQNGFDQYHGLGTVAAEKGSLKIAQCLIEHRHEWGREMIKSAARKGQLEMVRYLFESGCEHDSWAFWFAVRFEHLEIVRYLCDNGCKYDIWTFWLAVKSGNLEIVRCLHGKNLPLKQRAATLCDVECGHVHILQYLLENEFDFDREKVCSTAAQMGNSEIVQCLRDHGYQV